MQKTNIFKSKKTPAIILTILIFIILFLIIINPAKYTNVCFNAILVWAKVLLPCLLPFFIFTNLISKLNVAKDISSTFMPFTKKMYNVPPISSYAFFMSIITGYPVGSKIVSDLYYKGEISKSDAKKIVSFTSNSGPMFIIGSVGVGLFIDAKIGYIIMISHLVGAILNGLLYRNIKQDNDYYKRPNNNINAKDNNILSDSIMDSIMSILLVGGVIILSFIIIEILINFNVFYPICFLFEKIGIPISSTTAFLSGILEITKGCTLITSLSCLLQLKTILACFIITFGGVSTMLQAMAFLKNIVPAKLFILQKFSHAIISTIICTALCLIIL